VAVSLRTNAQLVRSTVVSSGSLKLETRAAACREPRCAEWHTNCIAKGWMRPEGSQSTPVRPLATPYHPCEGSWQWSRPDLRVLLRINEWCLGRRARRATFMRDAQRRRSADRLARLTTSRSKCAGPRSCSLMLVESSSPMQASRCQAYLGATAGPGLAGRISKAGSEVELQPCSFTTSGCLVDRFIRFADA